jgi:hypothetical protein
MLCQEASSTTSGSPTMGVDIVVLDMGEPPFRVSECLGTLSAHGWRATTEPNDGPAAVGCVRRAIVARLPPVAARKRHPAGVA